MSIDDAVKWAGSQAELARLLGVSRAAISKWATDGSMPHGRALQVELLSGGALRAGKSWPQRRSPRRA